MVSRRSWIVGVFISVFVVIVLGFAHMKRPHNQSLQTDLHVESADLGIPGVTKVYNATITNHGSVPVPITHCEFVDDTQTPGESVAYAIQRWNPPAQSWVEVLGTSRQRFCHPYPLGIIRAKLVRSLLWPRKSLEIGEEATAARDGLNLGDKVRFVLFTGEPGDYKSSLPTEAFTIDERPTSDVDLRVRH